jgi:stage II sporulation SpoAA-like protein
VRCRNREASARDDLMSITTECERDNICVLTIRGTLRKQDLDASQQDLIDAMGQTGTVRLLVLLDGFEGWERGADWGDLSFYLSHGDRIDRIAIVGPERWRSESLMFASADLRRAPVEFFVEGATADARRWLST